jgi:hypothetical protein
MLRMQLEKTKDIGEWELPMGLMSLLRGIHLNQKEEWEDAMMNIVRIIGQGH